MAKRTIQIKNGSTVLVTLYSGATSWAESDRTITNSTGLESLENAEIETVPKLFGNGSYVVSKRLNERTITIDGDIYIAGVRATYVGLESAYKSLTELTIVETGIVSRTISDCYLTNLTWEQRDDMGASFSLTFKALSG